MKSKQIRIGHSRLSKLRLTTYKNLLILLVLDIEFCFLKFRFERHDLFQYRFIYVVDHDASLSGACRPSYRTAALLLVSYDQK